MPTLEQWSIVDPDPYKAPEIKNPRMRGYIYGHPLHDDGKMVITSPVVKINDISRTITTKSGTIYKLGEVSADYGKMFPDAHNRVFGICE